MVEVLGAVLMSIPELTKALVEVARDSVRAVDEGRCEDAEPWILLEEKVGWNLAKVVWKHPELGVLLNAVDAYSFEVAHDRSHLPGGVSVTKLRELILSAIAALENGEPLPVELRAAIDE